MGIRYRQPKVVKMTPPEWTKEERTAFVWCITNNIKIRPEAVNSGYNEEWKIIISINDSIIVSPKHYGPKELYPKMLELYKFYYNKYNETNKKPPLRCK